MGTPSNDYAHLAAARRHLATTRQRGSAASFGPVRIFAAEDASVFLFIAAGGHCTAGEFKATHSNAVCPRLLANAGNSTGLMRCMKCFASTQFMSLLYANATE